MTMFKTTLLATALLAASPLAFAAGTATGNMTVSIEIQNNCTISANALSFGTPDTLAANIDAATTVSVSCSGLGAFNIGFNAGTGAGATFASRKMTGPALIDYALYRDAARTQVLDNSTVRIGATSTGVAQSFDVYGRVFAGQNPKPVGTYSDTVVATVSF